MRVLFDANGAALDDDTSPLVVRLDDQGATTVMSGWQGTFNTGPISHAWKRFGTTEQVSRYLWLGYGARTEFVGTPDPRTYAFAVVAHPDFLATFGGEGEEAPTPQWTSQVLAQTVTEVAAYAAGEAWQFVLDRQVTGTLTRFYDDDRPEEATGFCEWEETDEGDGPFLDYDWAYDQAWRYLAGEALNCRECKRGT